MHNIDVIDWSTIPVRSDLINIIKKEVVNKFKEDFFRIKKRIKIIVIIILIFPGGYGLMV